MNFGKRSTTRQRDSLISRTSMLGKRARVSIIRLLFVGLLALIVGGVCLGLGSFRGVIDNSPKASEVDIMPLGYATTLYDCNGTKLRELAAPNANRLPVSLDQIPIDLQHAVIAIEDERFYEHNGIDVKGILRAGVKALTTGRFTEGASTITQQLLKNNVFTSWTSESTLLEKFTRKFQEQYLAVEIEKINNKDVILENYMNTINLGAGAYGVQAAARQYFNKNVWELNLSECATLAGITQNPTAFNPIVFPEKNRERRQTVLEYMLAQGYITQEQFNEALADDVYTRIQQAQEEISSTRSTIYTYFEDELTDQVINDLVNIKGYTQTQARNMLYSGGLEIYTTQDPDIQDILNSEYQDESNFPAGTVYALDFALTTEDEAGNQTNYSKEMLRLYFQDNLDPAFDLLFDSQAEGREYVEQYKKAVIPAGNRIIGENVSFAPQPQSSMSIIDQHTGYVKAVIGGRGRKTASLTLNRATDTTRQPGSTFKILSTYAPALDASGMTLASSFLDEEYSYPDGSPVNNASRSYGGLTTIRDAIRRSVNVVAVKCLEQVTPEVGLKYLDDFGFTTLAHGTEADTDSNGNVWTDANLATALGGITRGVTNVELCAAYASIANGGNYIKPIYYTKILDHNGNVLIENTSVSRSVVSETTAWLLTSAMEDVVTSGTATACQLPNMPVAGKTGTTEAYNDLWFVGYTPYYTCAVWSGYDNNEKLPAGEARNFHKDLWRKVMTRIHENLPAADFERPAGIVEATVCAESGMLANEYCDPIIEFFAPGTVPTDYCEEHDYWTYMEDEEEDTVMDYDETTVEYDEYGNPILTPVPEQSTDDSSGEWETYNGEDYTETAGDVEYY